MGFRSSSPAKAAMRALTRLRGWRSPRRNRAPPRSGPCPARAAGDIMFGAVNANRRHDETAAQALARADRPGLSAGSRAASRSRALAKRSSVDGATSGRSSILSFEIMPSRIEDYAIIGDCESAALVGRNGSIDWLSWPRLDSDACFAALLGTSANGRWIIAPRNPTTRITRRYRANTLILETRFENEDGAATLIDFMPMPDKRCDLVRMVVGERGALPMRVEFVVRFGYGAIVPWVTRLEDGALRAIAGPDMLVLRTPVALHGQGLKTVGEFVITA